MAANQDELRRSKTDFISILSRDFLIFDMVHQKNILTERDYRHLVDKFRLDTEGAARTLIDKVRDKGELASTTFVNLLKENDLIMDTYPRLKEIFNLNPNFSQDVTQEVGIVEDISYTMSSDPRGFCVIINNAKFKDRERTGTQADVDALVKVFSWLGFRIVLCQDQTTTQMADVLRHFATLNLAELQKCNVQEWSGSQFTDIKNPIMHGDALVCCGLSHGKRGGICGVDLTVLPIADMISTFIGTNCPALVGKPKVFIFQACQGSKTQTGVRVDFAEEEEEGMEIDTEPCSASQPAYYIPEEADLLVANATVEKYCSFRDTVRGSWFIQSLCKQLEIGCKSGDDMLTIFTRVNDDVSLMEGAKDPGQVKQMPELRSTLRKKLIFQCKK